MAQKPVDRINMAGEKRDHARRARRLAQMQMNDADREQLMRFAANLDKEAEQLEGLSGAVLPLPDAVSNKVVQHEQLQQQQSAAQQDLEEDKD